MEQALQNVDQTLAESDDFDCTYESDMYDNGNIDWQNGIDVSDGSSIVNDRRSSTDQPKTITYEKKTMVKENNKETITWIRALSRIRVLVERFAVKIIFDIPFSLSL